MPTPPLVVLPVRDGVLPVGAAAAVAEARDGGDARVVVVGSQLGTAAGALAGVVERVELAEVGAVAVGTWAAALAPHVAAASFTILPASPDGRDLAARLAAATGVPLHAGALSVSADRVEVSHHGGLLQSTLHPAGPFVATLQPGVRAVDASGGDAIVTTALALDLPDPVADVEVLGVDPPDAHTMDLDDARRIVGAGAGLMGDRDDDSGVAERFDRLVAFGAAIGASMGATRVVTDAGWVPHSRQIGTTGVVVDPRLYIAFGISGAVQHTHGLGHPDHVISVNTDPHCPMMAMADLAIVADAVATLDALAERLEVHA